MEDPHQFFAVPKHMNKGRRLVGFPMDEVLPAFVTFGFAFWLGHEMIGMVIAMAWFGGLRYIKSQYGDHIIAQASYWWGASFMKRVLFTRTPAASKRYWIY